MGGGGGGWVGGGGGGWGGRVEGGVAELAGDEAAEGADAVAGADPAGRGLELVADAEDDPTLGGAVELRQDEAGDVGGGLEVLGLTEGGLALAL